MTSSTGHMVRFRPRDRLDELLRNRLWAYPWLIGVLLIFIGYQAYRIVLSPTLGLIALTGFDVVIVALT